jgi:GNAT superfamily N-acetyltransferase
MKSPADLRPRHSSESHFAVREASVPQWQVNRFLYLYVGQQWDWNDKRTWSNERWRNYVESPALRTFLGFHHGSIAGYYELHQQERNVEIAYFGLAPEFIGRGLGGPLLTSAIEEAWRWDAARVWVHTCTLDHPAALRNYEARGMRIYSTSKVSRPT